jgi:hypothetical protein
LAWHIEPGGVIVAACTRLGGGGVDGSGPDVAGMPDSEQGTATILDNGTIWIQVTEVELMDGGAKITYNLLEQLTFTVEEFEQMKAGNPVDKYGDTFSYFESYHGEEIYPRHIGYGSYSPGYGLSRGGMPYTFSVLDSEGTIGLTYRFSRSDEYDSWPTTVVVRGLDHTVTSKTVLRESAYSYIETTNLIGITTQIIGLERFEELVKNENSLYTGVFSVTIEGNAWKEIEHCMLFGAMKPPY